LFSSQWKGSEGEGLIMTISRDARVRFGAAAAFAVVFFGGVAVGFAVDRAASPAAEADVEATEAEENDDPAPSGWIIDQIEMDEAQRAQVDSLLKHYGKRMTELQKSFHPRYRALVDSTNQSLRSLLTADQIARYDALEAERLQWKSRQNSNASTPNDTSRAGH
jgi:hypothetical protein